MITLAEKFFLTGAALGLLGMCFSVAAGLDTLAIVAGSFTLANSLGFALSCIWSN